MIKGKPVKKGVSQFGHSDFKRGPKQALKQTNKQTAGEYRLFKFFMRLSINITLVLIALVAFGNSLTWCLQTYLGATENVWQEIWNKIVDVTGDDPYEHVVYGGLIYTIVIYWVIGGIFTFMDVTNKPAFLRKYKVQPGTNEPVDSKKLQNVILWVIFNQTFVAFVFAQWWYSLMLWRGMPPLREIPSLFTCSVHILVCAFAYESLFYVTHRLLHHRSFYRFIHKKHHEWISPIAVSAVYCHPIEHVVSNLFSVLMGPVFVNSHASTLSIWIALVHVYTLAHHSGYHLPFFISPEFHDFHHLKFNTCYGVFGLLDFCFKTDSAFRKSVAYKRHQTFFSLKSARNVYPDKRG